MQIINAYSKVYIPELFNNFKTLNPLSFFEDFQHIPILSDRFGLLNEYSTFNVVSTKDKIYLSNIMAYNYGTDIYQYFCECMNKRAECILNKAFNSVKKIYLMWSGGIDSTGVLISFIQAMKPEHKDIINLVFSHNAIKENPNMYEKYIDGKFNVIRTDNNFMDVYKYIVQNGIVVTGDCGDQLFGTDKGIMPNVLYNWFNSYKDFLKEMYPETNIDYLIDIFDNTFNQYNMNITKVHDFVWWMNFACKWDYVAHSLSYLAGTNYNTEIAFYDDKMFEVYALNINHDINVSEFREYKKDLKRYIYDFNKDKDYYIQKMKYGSSKTNRNKNKNMVFSILTENTKIINYNIAELQTMDYFDSLNLVKGILKNIIKPKYGFLLD